MGFSHELKQGVHGVTFDPGELEVLEDRERSAVFVHKEHGAIWHCVLSKFPFRFEDDLAGWKRRIESEAKGIFLDEWDERRAQPDSMRVDEPRTSDPTWSPIIESGPVDVDGEAVARVLHRTVYEPGMETIHCRFLIPVEAGTLELVCQTTDTFTGMRETVLMAGLMNEQDEPEHPGQAYFDDPKHDATFQDHALSRNRREVERVLRSGGFEISTDLADAEHRRVELPKSSCSLVPPPRFTSLPAETLPMAPTISHLSCVSLSTFALQPLLLSVWHLNERSVPPGDERSLTALARAIVEEWTSEGASDIKFRARSAKTSDDFSAEIEATVDFKVGESDVRDVQRWLVDHRGSVWRLSVGGPERSFPKREARALLAEARKTFEVDDVEPPRAPKPKRRWWPFSKS